MELSCCSAAVIYRNNQVCRVADRGTLISCQALIRTDVKPLVRRASRAPDPQQYPKLSPHSAPLGPIADLDNQVLLTALSRLSPEHSRCVWSVATSNLTTKGNRLSRSIREESPSLTSAFIAKAAFIIAITSLVFVWSRDRKDINRPKSVGSPTGLSKGRRGID